MWQQATLNLATKDDAVSVCITSGTVSSNACQAVEVLMMRHCHNSPMGGMSLKDPRVTWLTAL